MSGDHPDTENVESFCDFADDDVDGVNEPGSSIESISDSSWQSCVNEHVDDHHEVELVHGSPVVTSKFSLVSSSMNSALVSYVTVCIHWVTLIIYSLDQNPSPCEKWLKILNCHVSVG